MNVIVLGSGGREHALFLKLKQSESIDKIYFAPGNGGVSEQEKLDLSVTDFGSIEKAVKEFGVGLLVVGPEAPLAAGIVDYFKEKIPELAVFGPDKNGAQLEASKVFSNNFIEEAGIPAPKSGAADTLEQALAILENHPLPVVIKADGLAAGKGVTIHNDLEEARGQVRKIFNDRIFGDAGSKVLFQEFMTGKEASLFALCDGKSAIYLPTACDYKRAYDNGEGPNTGGMGSYSPGDILTPSQIAFADREIVQKVIDKFGYRGILYVGLMITGDQVRVVEFNCRLGDPETQSIMQMVETDLLPYLLWSAGKGEGGPKIKDEAGFYHVPTRPGYTINVVLSGKGYPDAGYQKGIPLEFPEKLPDGITVVHAGTTQKEGQLVSSGGRIANVVAYDRDPQAAIKKVYDLIEGLKKTNDFSRLHFRTDIGR